MSGIASTARIHPLAVVEDGATIGENAVIGPFCYIGARVTLGDDVEILSNAVVTGLTEIGRGGSYTVMHDSAEEPAVGFSLYIDPIIEAGIGGAERHRLFLPIGTDAATAARLRGEGWVTVAALEPGDTAEAQLCTHLLRDGTVRPVAG